MPLLSILPSAYLFSFSVALSLLIAVNASACPLIGKNVDFNCDGKLEMALLGDSLVAGFGDSINSNRGGYVVRAGKKLSEFEVNNFGILGDTTPALLTRLRKTFSEESNSDSLYRGLIKSDVIVLDLGRNDRWLDIAPSATMKNLRQISSLITSKIKDKTGAPPLVVTAVLMLPNRGSQGPWVKELNALILKSDSLSHPANLRFDLVSKRLIGTDQIHPTSAGYVALAKTFVSYVRGSLSKRLKQLRPDSDKDGIYDFFETNRYGTLSENPDTDGDGKSDGDEIFFLNSNPLSAD